MANSAAGGAGDYNTQIIEEFRANQGRVDAEFLDGAPAILIHHIGARSGTERVTPLACQPQPDGRFAHLGREREDRLPTPAGTSTSRAIPGSSSRWVPRRSRSWRRN